jgi:MFS family permease
MGPLSDRIGRVPAMRCGLLLQGFACLAFLAAHSLGSLLGASFLYGFGYATVSTLFPPLVADLFGRVHAGSIVGALFAIAGSLSGLGPWIAGALYDASGGYALTWALCAGLNALAFGCLLFVRPPTWT